MRVIKEKPVDTSLNPVSKKTSSSPILLTELDNEVISDVMKPSPSIETSVPEPPLPGDDMGVSSVINSLIMDELNTIQQYNSAIATLSSLNGYAPIINVLQDVVNEENVHVGQLQKSLSVVSPNAELINKGQDEASEQLDEPHASYDPNDASVAHPFMKVQSASFVAHASSDATVTSEDNITADMCNISDVDDTF